jgi:predicted extracellular nuclease
LRVSSPALIGIAPACVNSRDQQGRCAHTLGPQAASAAARSIPQIQDSGHASPYVNTLQSTEGVVTLLAPNGFYLQDPAGDGNPATSDGIFVFTGRPPAISTGDRVGLSARVTEFDAGDASRTVTQLTGLSGLCVISRGNPVTPADIRLPLASADDFERFEGMLVRITNPLTVSQNYFQGRYGQLTLSAGRLEKPTNRSPPRSAQAAAAAAANAARRIVLDDGKSTRDPDPVPYLGADGTPRAGDGVTGLVGVIDFGLITSSDPGPSGYKLQPAVPPVFSRDNPRPGAPLLPAGNVKVAAFNVLNFFTTFADGRTASGQTGQGCMLGPSTAKSNCPGADNLAEFQRQRAKIVAAIGAIDAIDADAVGLIEMQNNGDTAVSNLVDALNAAAGSAVYAVVPAPAATGSDAIRVAMIYKPSRLALRGAALSDPDPLNNRPPMAQTFAARNGQTFSVVVNHLKSRGRCPAAGSPDADAGDGQGCWNARRTRQAQRLASVFIPRVQAAAGNPDVLVIGDMNAYGMEDPVTALRDAGLINQVERFLRRGGIPYSYVFDDESGYIDHALTTASLSKRVLGVAEWHVNADEPAVLDYNTGSGRQDLYSASPYRASDHDPVIISLDL